VLSGIAIALGAALCWALGLRIFHRLRGYWQAATLAWIKSVIAALLFLLYFAVLGRSVTEVPADVAVAMVLSGVVGIALGDTALFLALYRLAERRTLLVAETAAPILVLILAFVLLGESLGPLQLCGVLLVLFGVDSVLGIRGTPRELDWIGVSWSLVAAVCQAVGVLISRLLLVETDLAADVSAFWRIAGACLALPFWLLLRKESLRPARRMPPRDILLFLAAVFIGTFLGILGLQHAIARLPAGLAQTLLGTTVLFSTVIGFLCKERIPAAHWLGTLIAVLGVGLIAAG
jgi:drug/metabolite transporter (DMT)-like permease